MKKVKEYQTTEEHKFSKNVFDQKILPAGTFVKPISLRWLPSHIVDSSDYRWFREGTDQFVYCNLGIIVIPKKIIKELK